MTDQIAELKRLMEQATNEDGSPKADMLAFFNGVVALIPALEKDRTLAVEADDGLRERCEKLERDLLESVCVRDDSPLGRAVFFPIGTSDRLEQFVISEIERSRNGES